MYNSDIGILNPFGVEKRAKNLVCRTRVDIVSSEEVETFGATTFLAHQILHRRDCLLIRSRPGVEYIPRHFLALVLYWIE